MSNPTPTQDSVLETSQTSNGENTKLDAYNLTPAKQK